MSENKISESQIQNRHGDVFDYAVYAMMAAYKLNSLQVRDHIDEISARNEKMEELRELKKEIRAWVNELETAIDDLDLTEEQAKEYGLILNGGNDNWHDFDPDTEITFSNRDEEEIGKIRAGDLQQYGGDSNKDGTITIDELEDTYDNIDDEIDSLGSLNQLAIIKLQQGINSLNLIVTLMTNLVKSESDTNEGVARNL